MERKREENKRILLTGGHAASSAFVVAEEIIRENKPWDVYWIGSKISVEGDKVSTLSSIYFPKYGIKTFSLISGRIQRNWTIHTIPSLLKIPVGFFHALFLLIKIKPDLVLSFGGFSAFPVVVVSYFMRIPVIIHEQTSVVGRANRFSSFFAEKIAISRETSRIYFPKNKTVLTGNPVPKEIAKGKVDGSLPKEKTILITGGQSGSLTINETVEKILPELLNEFKIIHLTGLKDEQKFKKIREKMSLLFKERYEVYGIVDPKKYNTLFNRSTVLISRAGANTASKIVVSRKPSILIPLEISYLDEQYKNAVFASDYAGAKIIRQKNLTSQSLLEELKSLCKNWKSISVKLHETRNPDIKASENIVSLIQERIK